MRFCSIIGALFVGHADGRLVVKVLKDLPDDYDPNKNNPADSKVIEGPDCGQGHVMVNHFEHAKAVGTAAGLARGTVMQARTNLELVSKKLDLAEEIGKEINDGEVPQDIEERVEACIEKNQASKEVADELEPEIDGFKEKVEATELKAKDVDLSDLTGLDNKSATLATAITAATDCSDETLKLAETQKTTALKDARKALKIMKATHKKMGPLIEKAKELDQTGRNSIDNADALYDMSRDEVTRVVDVAGTPSRPVAEEVSGLRSKFRTGFDKLDEHLGELDGARKAVEDFQGELNVAIDQGVAGNVKEVRDFAKKIPEVDEAIDKLANTLAKADDQHSKVQAGAKNLMEGLKKGEDSVEGAWEDLGQGCCRAYKILKQAPLFKGDVEGELDGCKAKCAESDRCGFISYGWPGSSECYAWKTDASCRWRNMASNECGSGGHDGVRSYQYVAR